MERVVEINIQGQVVRGVVVNVKESTERWSLVLMEDGTTVRLKPVVTEAFRTEQFNEEGQPVYIVKSTNVMTVDAPPKLLRPTADSGGSKVQ